MAIADTFATAAQMESRTNGMITATTHPFLEKELKAATRTIRNACRWHVAGQGALTYRKVRPFPDEVWLPAMQIDSITSAVIDGVTLDPAAVRFDPDTGWTNLRGCDVSIEYVAGYVEVPEDIVVLTLELAAGGLGTALNIAREQAGAVSITYARTSGALTLADADRLVPYKLGWLP